MVALSVLNRSTKQKLLYCFFLFLAFLRAMASKRLVPLLTRVLVEKIVPPSKISSGIMLPEKIAKLNFGNVIVVCPGAHSRDGNLIPLQ